MHRLCVNLCLQNFEIVVLNFRGVFIFNLAVLSDLVQRQIFGRSERRKNKYWKCTRWKRKNPLSFNALHAIPEPFIGLQSAQYTKRERLRIVSYSSCRKKLCKGKKITLSVDVSLRVHVHWQNLRMTSTNAQDMQINCVNTSASTPWEVLGVPVGRGMNWTMTVAPVGNSKKVKFGSVMLLLIYIPV